MRDADEQMRRAVIYKVQSFSTDGGPGIRTTVYFKGCPMACRWCENPEGISYRPELSYSPLRCILCGDCVDACPNGAISFNGKSLTISRRLCQACGTCVPACPAGALEVVGRSYTVPMLVELLKQDSVFYAHSGGGVTFSGGEAASQHSFLRALASVCKGEQIHTAIDTCLIHDWATYRTLVPYIDLWRVNLSLVGDKTQAEALGRSVQTILNNFSLLKTASAHIWVRTMIVPNWSDSAGNIQTIAQFVSRHLPSVERWELEAVSPSRSDRYPAQGQIFGSEEIPAVRAAQLNDLAHVARLTCDRRIPVITSGPTSLN